MSKALNVAEIRYPNRVHKYASPILLHVRLLQSAGLFTRDFPNGFGNYSFSEMVSYCLHIVTTVCEILWLLF